MKMAPDVVDTNQFVSPQIRDRCRELILDNDKLRKIMEVLLDNIERGLKKETHADSVVKCFPTYVQDLPNGTGTGSNACYVEKQKNAELWNDVDMGS
ncbi:hypothetical protein NQ315_012599, partial [Exocentrus adspersus]